MGTSRERKVRDNRSNQIAPVSELVFGGSSSSMMMDFNTRWAQSYESTVKYLIAIDLSFSSQKLYQVIWQLKLVLLS